MQTKTEMRFVHFSFSFPNEHCAMNISALYSDYKSKSGEQMLNINDLVAQALLTIVSSYFSMSSSNFVLTLSVHREHTNNFYNTLFETLFAKWKCWPIEIVTVKNNLSRTKVHGKRHFNMVLTDSYKAFL